MVSKEHVLTLAVNASAFDSLLSDQWRRYFLLAFACSRPDWKYPLLCKAHSTRRPRNSSALR